MRPLAINYGSVTVRCASQATVSTPQRLQWHSGNELSHLPSLEKLDNLDHWYARLHCKTTMMAANAKKVEASFLRQRRFEQFIEQSTSSPCFHNIAVRELHPFLCLACTLFTLCSVTLAVTGKSATMFFKDGRLRSAISKTSDSCMSQLH